MSRFGEPGVHPLQEFPGVPRGVRKARVDCIETYRQPGLGGGGTSYKGLSGETPPEMGTFFMPQVYERSCISLVEVYERAGKSVLWV